jgi:hypothetical protein
MGLPALDNLVRIGQLKEEARNIAEYEGLLDVEESTVTEICNLLLI